MFSSAATIRMQLHCSADGDLLSAESFSCSPSLSMSITTMVITANASASDAATQIKLSS